ncbi:polysaccharide biosynthesis/export family protein [Nitrospira sp. NS4]|uniref:polysaccharide biosynthesis/export family protein n=1 Tax=Nitrospira sp. NS4 TaxID=3414498 RepID=UPI003C2DC49D
MCLVIGFAVMLLAACAEIPREAVEEVNRPLPKEFLLGPEDLVEVTVWRNQDLSRTVVVRPDGMISLPLIGDVQASGLTAAQVGERISKRLSEFKENPSVSVSVKEINSYFVYVVGEVMRPGKYPLKSYATVLQAISLAGGFTQYASKNKLAVMRSTRNSSGDDRQIRIPVRYDDLVMGKGQVGNFRLLSGDTIVVP